MSDIIQLLPDAVANQIAAGEVIQRPSSVVKELLENAIDAGSDRIQLIVKDAGRTLIQVVDNGCGMSEMDARLSFEKHATSKIRSSEDLFHIRTKGFRGEALASLGAVAQVEMKTRLRGESIGTHIRIEGSKVLAQEACQCAEGTTFWVKNLFFNVPARREFLKSDSVEMRHIIDEFQRVAFTHPEIAFSLHHNSSEVFNLHPSILRQRIVNVLGNKYDQRLVPLEEGTDILKVQGFVGKPEFARKSRGEQFFFINHRYVKNHYLHHAVVAAFDELLPKGLHPLYFIYIDIDPSEIDVNIHPSKTEVKFKDDRMVYAIINSAIRQSLGKFNIMPSIDFEVEQSIQVAPLVAGQGVKQPEVRVNPDFNPFDVETPKKGLAGRFGGEQGVPENWADLFEITAPNPETKTVGSESHRELSRESEKANFPVFQWAGSYIVSSLKSGLIVVDQQRAHERVLYEKHLTYLSRNCGCTQQLLFPQTMDFTPSDFELIVGRLDQIQALGFDIEPFGTTTIKFNGLPAESRTTEVTSLFEKFLDQIKNHCQNLENEPQKHLAVALARSMAISSGTILDVVEMRHLLDELFGCESPGISPTGLPTIATFTHADLELKFKG